MRLYFITSNTGKFIEVNLLLSSISSLETEQLKISYPEIQAGTLRDVTEFALNWLAQDQNDKLKGSYVMIEDSGLFVERLKGFPGIYSSYVHSTIGGYKAILTLLEGEWDRRARFETCIGLLTPGGEKEYFTGTCVGTLQDKARGKGGFGYDPIFIPEGKDLTFAEMSTTEKNQFSHRSKAVTKLIKYLEKNL